MYKFVGCRAVLAVGLSCFLISPSLGQEAGTNAGPSVVLEDIQDSFIFVFGPSVPSADVDFRARALVAGAGGRLRHIYSTAIRGFAANMSPVAATNLFERNPNIAYFERDGLVTLVDQRDTGTAKKPSNPGGGKGGGDTTPAPQDVPWGIERVGGPFDGTGLTAWVIDTGIDFDHADLNVDVARSANFVFRGKDSAKDGHGHGTHVAGTMAAMDNEFDVVGVAAGASVVAVRVLDNSGSGSISGVVAGVDYVAANGSAGDVANMSLSGSGHWQSLHDAVTGAGDEGILFSLAAGNSAADANGSEPAHVEHPNVYTVSAIDSADVFAWFSNYGNPPIDFAAPGVSVLSTKKGGGTTTFSGTSMAAPHVGGLLLLVGLPFDNVGSALGDPDGNADPIAHK